MPSLRFLKAQHGLVQVSLAFDRLGGCCRVQPCRRILGATAMPSTLKRSPQTEPQRSLVRTFVSAVRAAKRLDADLQMKAGGMPGGYM